jgi:hypothetical protein
VSKPALFLETTIQIERIVGDFTRQRALRAELANYRLVTSTYVLGEYLRTLVKDAVQLHRLVAQQPYLDEVITYLGQHINKREASRMMLMLGSMLRIGRTIELKHDTQARLDLLDRLARYIELSLLSHFMVGIDEVLDSTQCGLARERPQVYPIFSGNTPSYRLRAQCVRQVRECDLAERMEQWQPELKAVAAGLAFETDPILVRMGQLAQQIVDKPVLARGRNCTWHLGDLVIALELPAALPLYTTNRRHFAPLLAILGKKLHSLFIP